MSLRIRRGTDAQRAGITFDLGELVYASDTKQLFVGDGTTVGGINAFSSAAGFGITFNEATQSLDVVPASLNLTTTEVAEGTNLYFTSQRAQDSTAALLSSGTQTGITAAYDTNAHTLNLSVDASNTLPIVDGNATAGVLNTFSRGDHIHPTDLTRAPLISPAFVGTPTATTLPANNNGTALATTAYVQTAIKSSYVAADTGVANALAVSVAATISALTSGLKVIVQNIVASNTGTTTLNVNNLGALPIIGVTGNTLQGGELGLGYDALFVLDHTMTHWQLIQTTGGSLPVAAATQSNHAINLGQAQNTFAALAGISTQVFSVADALSPFNAVNLGQVQSITAPRIRYIQSFTAGLLTANAYIHGEVSANAPISLPVNFANSYATATVAATASQTINVMVMAAGGTAITNIGSVTFAAGAYVGTFTTVSTTTDTVINPGDTIFYQVGATADTTLENVSISIVGTY